ncbi:MAG: type II/IV secretion system protein [Frankiales bacterium]|nr:type II/IV secretion system protein [Frankiales bacterium]
MALRRTKDDARGRHAATATAVQLADEIPAQPTAEEEGGWTRLGEIAVQRSRVTQKQVAEALLQQSASGKQLGRLLVELGALTDRELALSLAEQMNLALVDLAQEQPDADAIARLPETIARSETVVPMLLVEGTLVVAVAEPSAKLLHQLTAAAGLPVTMVVAPSGDIKRAIDASYRALTDIDAHVAAFQQAEAGRTKTSAKAEAAAGLAATATEDAPVVQLVNKVLVQALRDRASDVHIEPQDDRIRVRFRIDGALHDVLALPADIGPALVSRIKIMAGMNIVERRRPQDGQLAMTVDGRDVDVRVATVGVHWGEKVVMRVLDKSRSLKRLDDLGMPQDTHAAFSKLIRAPFGMVLCAGPTGSGKTTTLYASLSELNESQRNIMTIEDPVEYVFPSINQIQTNEQAGLTFSTGLKSILRQDPDIILVGESRDVDTARIAVQSALTGHLVLSSLHATDAVAALHRFLDMGIESFLVASSVLAVVGQRLVRRTCQSCKAPYKPTDEELAFYEEGGGKPKRTWFAGEGCHLCADTGYQDRIGVYELLRITPEIKRLVVGWATQDELRRMAVSQGMRTLQDESIRLVENNITTISEVVRAIYAY